MSDTVAFYVSGHGLGHASRQIEIINALPDDPGLDVVVRTTAAPWLFERTLRRAATVEPCHTDTGVRQIDSLRLDAARTIRDAARFYGDLDARADAEAARLQEIGATLVLADTPPLACEAAARAAVPCVVVGNFTWDWIYAFYAAELAEAPWLVPVIERAYARACAAWRLPMSGGFASIGDVADVPFVARHARHQPATVRAAFGLPADRPLVLASFGGYGVDRPGTLLIDAGACAVVTTAGAPGALRLRTRDGVHVIDERRLYATGYRYEDLVAAVDIVITKPGYGIIAECIANRTAILYTSRGEFVEYDRLVAEMPRYLACEYISHADLFAGRWAPALGRLLGRRPPVTAPRTDGANVIAELVRTRLAGRASTEEAR